MDVNKIAALICAHDRLKRARHQECLGAQMIRPPPDLLFSLLLGQYRCSLICRVKIALRPPHWQRLEPHKPLARCLTLQKPASRQENAQNKGFQTLRHFVRLNPNAHSRYGYARSEEHTSELQSRGHLVCRL